MTYEVLVDLNEEVTSEATGVKLELILPNSVKQLTDSLEKFLNENVAPTQAPLMALLTFKDEVTVTAFTKDLNVLLKVLKSLKAEGGGSCPEASVEALELATQHVKPGGQIWLSTDAVSLFGFSGEDTQFAGFVTG